MPMQNFVSGLKNNQKGEEKMSRYEEILNSQFKMTDGGRVDYVKDLYTTYCPEVDLQAMIDGGYIDALGDMMEPVLISLDDRSPEVMAYWAKHGMVKEFHGDNNGMNWEAYENKTGYKWVRTEKKDGIQNFHKSWTSFVPVSAFQPENAGRKYPTVIVLHGGFNPVSIIDGWGFPQEAARKEWIIIVPSIELDDILDEILEEAKTLYPIDESRIYATGFSYGGFMTNLLGNKRPDVYAAVAPCGVPLNDAYCEEAIGPEPQKPFDGKSRALEMGIYMPVFNCAGNLDGNRFPIYAAGRKKAKISHISPSPETLVEGINNWARVNHASEIKLADVMNLENRTDISEEERGIGIPLAEDCRRTVVADGITNYIGDLKSEDGIVRVRIMCEMNMPHWPIPEMIRQMYAFFEHFSRNVETKESIYTE